MSDGPSRGGSPHSVDLRRLVVQALGRAEWPLGLLCEISGGLKGLEWPEGAEGAELGVLRALNGAGNLRLQLIGAFAVPGWSEAVLVRVAKALSGAAPAFEGEEISAMRAALRGLS